MYLNDASGIEELNAIFDDPGNMAIVNASRWPVIKAVDVQTKTDLLQCLIVEELIHKRNHNMQVFRKGLNALGFRELCQQSQQLTKQLFVYNEKPLTPVSFLEVMSSTTSAPDEGMQHEAAALRWFIKYIHDRGSSHSADTLETISKAYPSRLCSKNARPCAICYFYRVQIFKG